VAISDYSKNCDPSPAWGRLAHDAHGFTIVEVLTVMAVVAVLTSLLVAATGGAKEMGRNAHARSDLLLIVSAIKAYQIEYGTYPVRRDQDGGEVTFATDNSDLFNVLRDVPAGANTDHALNPRRIVFLDVASISDVAHPRSGIAHGIWFDPWGPQDGKLESGVYHVRIDAAGNHRVTNPYPGADPDESVNQGAESTIHTDVIAWSLAKDGVQTYELRDQVISWK
jgi:prepilin-type N-terminal cleavage/methylation domain-containing protein